MPIIETYKKQEVFEIVTEEELLLELFKRKFGRKYGTIHTCKQCHKISEFIKVPEKPLYECPECNDRINPAEGTFFGQIKVPLKTWLLAFQFLNKQNLACSDLSLVAKIKYSDAQWIKRCYTHYLKNKSVMPL